MKLKCHLGCITELQMTQCQILAHKTFTNLTSLSFYQSTPVSDCPSSVRIFGAPNAFLEVLQSQKLNLRILDNFIITMRNFKLRTNPKNGTQRRNCPSPKTGERSQRWTWRQWRPLVASFDMIVVTRVTRKAVTCNMLVLVHHSLHSICNSASRRPTPSMYRGVPRFSGKC